MVSESRETNFGMVAFHGHMKKRVLAFLVHSFGALVKAKVAEESLNIVKLRRKRTKTENNKGQSSLDIFHITIKNNHANFCPQLSKTMTHR